MDGKDIEDDAQNREQRYERKVIAHILHTSSIEFALIEPSEKRVCCHIANQQNRTKNGKSQLAHSEIEKHNAHHVQNENENENHA